MRVYVLRRLAQSALTLLGVSILVFVILRVLDALSGSPGTELLPNPYEDRSAAFYDLQNAGMRLRYRRASLRL